VNKSAHGTAGLTLNMGPPAKGPLVNWMWEAQGRGWRIQRVGKSGGREPAGGWQPVGCGPKQLCWMGVAHAGGWGGGTLAEQMRRRMRVVRGFGLSRDRAAGVMFRGGGGCMGDPWPSTNPPPFPHMELPKVLNDYDLKGFKKSP